jgi:hypothetical protein
VGSSRCTTRTKRTSGMMVLASVLLVWLVLVELLVLVWT